MYSVQSRCADDLFPAGGPANFSTINPRRRPEPEVQPPLILRTKAASAGDLLQLFLSVPEHSHLGPNGAPVTLPASERELNPLVSTLGGVTVHQQRPFLVRHHG